MDANPDELAISHYVSDGALIIEVAGEIDLHTATELQRSVDRLSPFPHPVTLDLAGVGLRGAGIDAAQALDHAGVEQQAFGQAGLTGVDVCQDPQVQRSHEASCPLRRQCLPAVGT